VLNSAPEINKRMAHKSISLITFATSDPCILKNSVGLSLATMCSTLFLLSILQSSIGSKVIYQEDHFSGGRPVTETHSDLAEQRDLHPSPRGTSQPCLALRLRGGPHPGLTTTTSIASIPSSATSFPMARYSTRSLKPGLSPKAGGASTKYFDHMDRWATGAQPRRSSCCSPCERMHYPKRLRRPRWLPSLRCP
jgi:hypothetical protein